MRMRKAPSWQEEVISFILGPKVSSLPIRIREGGFIFCYPGWLLFLFFPSFSSSSLGVVRVCSNANIPVIREKKKNEIVSFAFCMLMIFKVILFWLYDHILRISLNSR